MDFLKAEIARKRKITDEIRQNVINNNNNIQQNLTNVNLKYLSQKDIMEADTKARIVIQTQYDESIEIQTNKKKMKINDNIIYNNTSDSNNIQTHDNTATTATNNNTNNNTITTNSANSDSFSITNAFLIKQLKSLSIIDIKLRLRSMSEPITIYNESNEDRVDRLIHLLGKQLQYQNDNDDEDDVSDSLYKLNSNAGSNTNTTNKTNDLSDSDDDNDNNEKQITSNSNTANNNSNSNPTKKQSKNPLWFLNKNIKYHLLQNYTDGKVVYKYFRSLLKHWEYNLMNRNEYIKTTAKGKAEIQTYKRCKEYLKPFFKMCLSKKIEEVPETLPNVYAMVEACEQNNYVLANDWYIKTAIGNSAWPIGVTMVGIHERSNREKITKVAHVMNNEFQRKYLTSIKQLMSFAQEHSEFDIAPSMKVM